MKDKKEKQVEEEKVDINATLIKKLDEKEEQLKKANQDTEYWKNEYYKAYADMANLRKEIEKDHQEVKKYRIEGFVDNLVAVLDSFDIALNSTPKSDETRMYLEGFKYVHSQLINVLENEGIQVIEPQLNGKFDERTMHAIDTIECDGEENIVKEIKLKGYKLYDHLIRPSMVVVSKNKIETKPEEKSDEEVNKA